MPEKEILLPPITYTGNKGKLMADLLKYMPKDCDGIVDIFGGSGTVGFNSPYNKVIYNEFVPHVTELIEYLYKTETKQVLNQVEKLIKKYNLAYPAKYGMEAYPDRNAKIGLKEYNSEGYYKLRDDYNKKPSPEKLLVLAIYAFNGGYIRFSSDGKFNVPCGTSSLSETKRDKLIKWCNGVKEKEAIFISGDFRNEELYKEQNYLYYADSPYSSEVDSSASYNVFWNFEDDKALMNLCDKLNEEGKKFMMSNVLESKGKEAKVLKEWASKYNVVHLDRSYTNASHNRKNRDKKDDEVIIMNYDVCEEIDD